jgi:hypothetical protein
MSKLRFVFALLTVLVQAGFSPAAWADATPDKTAA